MISREDTAKYSPGPDKMNRDGEDTLPDLSPIPEFVASSFQMIYLLGVNQRNNPLDSTRERYCHKRKLQNWRDVNSNIPDLQTSRVSSHFD